MNSLKEKVVHRRQKPKNVPQILMCTSAFNDLVQGDMKMEEVAEEEEKEEVVEEEEMVENVQEEGGEEEGK